VCLDCGCSYLIFNLDLTNARTIPSFLTQRIDLMTNSKGSSSTGGSRAAKSGGGSTKYDRLFVHQLIVTVNFSCRTTSSRPAGNGSRAAPHTKPSSSSSAPPEVQAKTQPAKSDKVVFSGTAKKQLDSLGLSEKHRQDVVRWHERTTRREMNLLGADRAKIR
jgi:hypothetical protein